MRKNIKPKIMPIIVLLVCLSLSGCMAMMAPMMATHAKQSKEESEDTFWKKIELADTPKKHRSIAKAYRQDAEDYRLLAKEHQRRKEAYRGYSKNKPVFYKISQDTIDFTIIHCQRLAEKFTELADEMERMAQKHEEMAEKVAERQKELDE